MKQSASKRRKRKIHNGVSLCRKMISKERSAVFYQRSFGFRVNIREKARGLNERKLFITRLRRSIDFVPQDERRLKNVVARLCSFALTSPGNFHEKGICSSNSYFRHRGVAWKANQNARQPSTFLSKYSALRTRVSSKRDRLP